MDPIAFFDHLAANSTISHSSHGGGEEEIESCSSISNIDRDSYSKHHQQLTASHSLETIKSNMPPLREQTVEHNKENNSFQERWNNLVQTYRTEKEGKS